MVTGEHAVVYGYPSMVAAIDQRITMQCSPRSDRRIQISSHIAPTSDFSLDDITIEGPYRFVLACIELYKEKLHTGFDLSIESMIDPTLGLGSSAAVTIAAMACVRKVAGVSVDKPVFDEMHAEALSIVRSIQGRGSGADLAASLHGGLIAYQIKKMRSEQQLNASNIESLPLPPPLYLAYCGYKTPTADVLEKIAQDMLGKETFYQDLYKAMGDCAAQTIDAAKEKNWLEVAEQLNLYQSFMADLGVSDSTLDKLVDRAKISNAFQAAKISGSGLGDCVLAMSKEENGFNVEGFSPVNISETGLIVYDK